MLFLNVIDKKNEPHRGDGLAPVPARLKYSLFISKKVNAAGCLSYGVPVCAPVVGAVFYYNVVILPTGLFPGEILNTNYVVQAPSTTLLCRLILMNPQKTGVYR